jgi:hypothetical protein
MIIALSPTINIMGKIYALILEGDNFYVGYTDRPNGDRFLEHFDNNGSAWTKLHPAKQVLEFKDGTKDDEDELTLKYMNQYGWWRVRGGKWCQVTMTACPEALLQKQGISLPKPIKSPEKVNQKEPIVIRSPLVCTRCGRKSHTADKCFAKMMSDGISPVPDTTSFTNSNFSRDLGTPSHHSGLGMNTIFRFSGSNDSRLFGSNVPRTAMNVKFVVPPRVMASPPSESSKKRKFESRETSKPSNQTRLSTKKSPFERSLGSKYKHGCFRCGRTNHNALTCYAKSNINGDELDGVNK